MHLVVVRVHYFSMCSISEKASAASDDTVSIDTSVDARVVELVKQVCLTPTGLSQPLI